MSTSSHSLSKSEPLEEGIDAVLQKAEQKVVNSYHGFEDCVRQSPTKSVLAAVAAGYVLHRLPVRSLVVAQVRLVSALAPSALLLLGAAKVYEFFQQEAAKRP